MEPTEAWVHLGIDPTTDLDEIRAAYVARLHVVHPDKAPAADAAGANAATIALTAAYRTAVDSAGIISDADVVPIAMSEDDTIAVALPPDATYSLLVEAAHRLGEVTHIEPSSGLLQVVIEFVEAPPCSLLASLQGRATGVTEVFCTLESLEAEPAPPVDAVVRLLLDEMVAVSAG